MMLLLRMAQVELEVDNKGVKHIAQTHIMQMILNRINGKRSPSTIMIHELVKAMNLEVVVIGVVIRIDNRRLMNTIEMRSVAMNNKSHMKNSSIRTREDIEDIMSQATSSVDVKIEGTTVQVAQ